MKDSIIRDLVFKLEGFGNMPDYEIAQIKTKPGKNGTDILIHCRKRDDKADDNTANSADTDAKAAAYTAEKKLQGASDDSNE